MKALKHVLALGAVALATTGCCDLLLLPLYCCAAGVPNPQSVATAQADGPPTEILMPIAATRSALPKIQRY